MTDKAADAQFDVTMTTRARRLVRCLWLVAILLALTTGGAILAAETMALHIPSQTVALPNGLTVVVSPKEKLPVACDQRPV